MALRKVTEFELKCVNYSIHYLINLHTPEINLFIDDFCSSFLNRLTDEQKFILYNDITKELLNILYKYSLIESNTYYKFPIDILCEKYNANLLNNEFIFILNDLLCWQKLSKILNKSCYKNDGKTYIEIYKFNYNNNKYFIEKFYF